MFGGYLATAPPTVEIWSSLFNYYNVLGTIAAILVISYLVYNIIRYRRKDGSQSPSAHREEDGVNWKRVLLTLAITGSVLFFVGWQTFNSEALVLPPQDADALHIGVVGQQWSWTFVYPNGVRVVGNLTVPAGKTVILNITSTDVAHSFSISDLRVAVDAIPGRYNTLWFGAPSEDSTYVIRCKELCGVGHAFMTATVKVVSQSAYDNWYSSLGVT